VKLSSAILKLGIETVHFFYANIRDYLKMVDSLGWWNSWHNGSGCKHASR